MKKLKAYSLPINILIVFVIGVIALIGVIVFFSNVFGGGSSAMDLERGFRQICSAWATIQCSETNEELVKEVGKRYIAWVYGLSPKNLNCNKNDGEVVCNMRNQNSNSNPRISIEELRKTCCGK